MRLQHALAACAQLPVPVGLSKRAALAMRLSAAVTHLTSLLGCTGGAVQVCHAAADEVLVTGGYDTAVKVWDCRSWNQEPIQTMRQCKVNCLTWTGVNMLL